MIEKEESMIKYPNGYTRVPIKEAYHLICPELERRLSLIYAEGLKKYKDMSIKEAEVTTARFNSPLDDLIRHMKRHFNLWLSGDRTEDHLAKLAWGITQIMHQEIPSGCQHINIFLNEDNKYNANAK